MSEPTRKQPTRTRKIGSRLRLFDCVSCDKCIPGCHAGAMLTYATPVTASLSQEAFVTDAGQVGVRAGKPFRIDQPVQYAVWLDDCDECGDCDSCCPEDGGPHLSKPRLHSSHRSFEDDAARDGIYLSSTAELIVIEGRLDGHSYRVERGRDEDDARLSDGVLTVVLDAQSGAIRSAAAVAGAEPPIGHRLAVHAGRSLLAIAAGLLDALESRQ